MVLFTVLLYDGIRSFTLEHTSFIPPQLSQGGGTIDAPNLRESELMPDEDDGEAVYDARVLSTCAC